MQTSCTTTNNYTSSSSSSPSPSPSHSSSITHHSAIASSTASSSSLSSSLIFPSSSPSPSPSPSSSRCIGLNLLVKAIHQVTAGSIIGVPYIQHRIVTRRKRPIHFNNLIIATASKKISKPKAKGKGKRRSAMPSKYKDSVLQPTRRSERTSSSSSAKITTNGE